jgi:hypothetical protein
MKKLYPELDNKAQLTSLFEDIYSKKNRSILMSNGASKKN